MASPSSRRSVHVSRIHKSFSIDLSSLGTIERRNVKFIIDRTQVHSCVATQ
ncbi:MAG TPA: hypothetical protein VF597_01780 [Candidatus Saccharimonadales bacterium]